MILCDRTLRRLCEGGIIHPGSSRDEGGSLPLLDPYDPELVNPASIDIRVGNKIINEDGEEVDMTVTGLPYLLESGEFVLVETLEKITVPNGFAVDLRLKSSRAREGYNHSLAFWFDPGWSGIGTMEIQNITSCKQLPLYPGMKIGQIIVHQLDEPAEKPYRGKYQGAVGVEGAKP